MVYVWQKLKGRPVALDTERYRLAHHYFAGDSSKFDAQAMRDEAEQRAFDKREPEDSVIHHHFYDENGHCPEGSEHDFYLVGHGRVVPE
jgi:hypothetical protein